jgi:hypothetical protein
VRELELELVHVLVLVSVCGERERGRDGTFRGYIPETQYAEHVSLRDCGRDGDRVRYGEGFWELTS